MKNLLELRQLLHSHAELSNQEFKTREILLEYLSRHRPIQIIKLAGGKALLVEFDSGIPGPHIVYRADLDALPIPEELPLIYKSNNPGVSHKCGHDGHMTLACALPAIWDQLEKKTGKLGLLFQHAEEVSIGAMEIIQDKSFKDWKPDMILGLHNLPGYAETEVVLAYDVFSCASMGLALSVQGTSSHAGEPEKALSPYKVLIETAALAQNLISTKEDENFFLSTLVHLRLGSENYGITPGDGKVCFTLRAQNTELLLEKKSALVSQASSLASQGDLTVEEEVFDFFPATSNSRELVKILENTVIQAGLTPIVKTFPFRWSEDFGHYSKICPSVFFGIGNGRESFPLHHPQYDFSDKSIGSFQKLFQSFLRLISEPQKS